MEASSAKIIRAEQLLRQADNLRDNGDVTNATKRYEQAIVGFKKLNDILGQARSWQMLGVNYKVEGDLPTARQTLEKALALFKRINNHHGIGNTLRDIGMTYSYEHKYQKALPYLRRSITELKKADNLPDLGITHTKIGLALRHLGKYRAAQKELGEGLRIIRQADDWFREMTAILNLAELKFAQGQTEEMLTDLWGAYGILLYEKQLGTQKRRVAQITGLLAHGYALEDNPDYSVRFLIESLRLLKPMKPSVRQLVLEDIKLKPLLKLLSQRYPGHYRRVTTRTDFSTLGLSQ